MTEDTPADTGMVDYDAEPEEEWLEEPEQELPRRPRHKLLAPVPVTLLVILLLAGAFLAGVEVEKGQGSSSTTSGLSTGLAALRSRAGLGGAKAGSGGASSGAGALRGGAAGGFPGAAALFGGAVTTGEVTFANGNTLYVTSGEGNTVKVSAPEGTKVTKTVSTDVRGIHPGDTVIVRGTQNKNGSVSASSITVSSAGASATGSGGSSTSGAGAAQQLFGAG